MTDAKGMFDFTIFLGVFYFLYFVLIVIGQGAMTNEIVIGEEALTDEGDVTFKDLVKTFFVPFPLESGWKFLNLLIFLPIYIFLLFTAVEMAEKSVVGSHIVLGIVGVLFAGSFIALIMPEGFEFTAEGIKTFFIDTVGVAIKDGIIGLGVWLKDGIIGIGSYIKDGILGWGSDIWEAIKFW